MGEVINLTPSEDTYGDRMWNATNARAAGASNANAIIWIYNELRIMSATAQQAGGAIGSRLFSTSCRGTPSRADYKISPPRVASRLTMPRIVIPAIPAAERTPKVWLAFTLWRSAIAGAARPAAPCALGGPFN
jgi:hypothetical protein